MSLLNTQEGRENEEAWERSTMPSPGKIFGGSIGIMPIVICGNMFLAQGEISRANTQLEIDSSHMQPLPQVFESSTFDFPAEGIEHNKIQDEIDLFSEGIDVGYKPSQEILESAMRICRVAVKVSDHPDIIVDDAGALSFDFRFRNGNSIMAEIDIDGSMYVSVKNPQKESLYRSSISTEKDFIEALNL